MYDRIIYKLGVYIYGRFCLGKTWYLSAPSDPPLFPGNPLSDISHNKLGVYFLVYNTITMAEDGRAKVDKFEGHDFAFWKMQIEDLLYQKKFVTPVKISIVKVKPNL